LKQIRGLIEQHDRLADAVEGHLTQVVPVDPNCPPISGS
jgi:hypothetical protein